MVSRKYVIQLLLMTSCLSGCAAGKLVGTMPTIENDDYATVHIARPSGFTGCGVRTTIELDHQEFFWLACGDHISFRVPANKAVTISQTTSTRPDHLEIEPEKGKVYYFGNDCNWVCWFEETKKSYFQSLASRCDKEQKIGY